jgi:hypothetical protein
MTVDLEKVLNGCKVSKFATLWIAGHKVEEDSVKQVYEFLKSCGICDKKIATHASLLGIDIKILKDRYDKLLRLGISKKDIATYASLLGRDAETVYGNYEILRDFGINHEDILAKPSILEKNPETVKTDCDDLEKMGVPRKKIFYRLELLEMNRETLRDRWIYLNSFGLSDKSIAKQPHLLEKSPESIKYNHGQLKRLGLSNVKIDAYPALLGSNPKTIKRNYQHHVGLLREDYRDRNSGKATLLCHAQLLWIPASTIDGNVQFMSTIGIDYNNGYLLGTRPQTKRAKMAWLLREVFDYRQVPEDEKRNTIHRLYDFVRKDPQILGRSLAHLEKNKGKLRRRIEK